MEMDMTRGRVLPKLLRFVLPLFLGNIFQQLYNMVDTILVGRFVGANALAAVGSTGTVMFLLIGFSQGITSGFSVLTAQRFGAGREQEVRRSVANAILLSLIISVIMTIVCLLSVSPLLTLMHTPADIVMDASAYLRVICMGLIAPIFYNLFSSFLRAIGNSQMPLVFLIISATMNIVLDLAFIVGLKMGVAGAAWATNLAQGFSAVLCLLYILKKTPVLRPARKQWRLHGGDSVRQLTIGIPMALQFAITASGTMVMQSAINLFGSLAVAAFTAASKATSLVTQGMVSLGQAMATYAGQNYGRGERERVRLGVRVACGIATVYSLACMVILCEILPTALKLFFDASVDMEALMPWARTYVYQSVIFFVPLSFIFIFRNAMQGCGYGLLPMLGGVSELVARVIAAYIAMTLHSYALACFCDPAAWLTAAIFTGVSYIFVMRDIDRRAEAAHAQEEPIAY